MTSAPALMRRARSRSADTASLLLPCPTKPAGESGRGGRSSVCVVVSPYRSTTLEQDWRRETLTPIAAHRSLPWSPRSRLILRWHSRSAMVRVQPVRVGGGRRRVSFLPLACVLGFVQGAQRRCPQVVPILAMSSPGRTSSWQAGQWVLYLAFTSGGPVRGAAFVAGGFVAGALAMRVQPGLRA